MGENRMERQLKIGDWVTQYKTGFWQVLGFQKCYWEEDINEFKKGDYRGEMVFLKKAFTNKLKFRLDGDMCHVNWCKKLSENQLMKINDFFEKNPDKLTKFTEFIAQPIKTIATCYFHFNEDQRKLFSEIFDALKNKINYDSILELLQQNNLYDCMTNRISLEDDFYWVQFVNINNELDENNKLLYTYSDLIKHSDI